MSRPRISPAYGVRREGRIWEAYAVPSGYAWTKFGVPYYVNIGGVSQIHRRVVRDMFARTGRKPS